MMQTLAYSACTTSCSLTLLGIPVDVNYTVTVTITRSTNPGVSGNDSLGSDDFWIIAGTPLTKVVFVRRLHLSGIQAQLHHLYTLFVL